MPFVCRTRSKLGRRSIAKNCDGTAAIELAMIAPVFFMILFGTITIGWDFAVASSIDSAIVKISRQVADHSSQPVDEQSVRTAFCQSRMIPGQCEEEAFSIQIGPPTNGAFRDSTESFVDIQPGSINVIRITALNSLVGSLTSKNVSLGASYAVFVKP